MTRSAIRGLAVLVFVALSAACGGKGGGGGPAPAVTVSAISGTTSEAGGSATFTVVLTAKPSADVVLSLSSSNANEGSVSPSTLTFTRDDFKTPKTVTVTGVDDFVADGNVQFDVGVSAPQSSDARYAALGAQKVTVTNVDDDSAGVTASAASPDTDEWGRQTTISVQLTSQPLADVVLAPMVSDTSEGAVVVGTSLTFTPANWNVAQTVTVRGLPDGVADGDQPYQLGFAPAQSTDAGYSGYQTPAVALVNLDTPHMNVGYYDMSAGTGSAYETAPITAIGQTATSLDDLTSANLAGIDVLFVCNPSNSSYGAEYSSRLADIQAAVDAGMILVIHDRYVTDAATILPNGSGFAFTRDTSTENTDIDVADSTTIVTNGPAGTIDDTSLDGGNSSSHGYVDTATLPMGATTFLVRPTATHGVTFAYKEGMGTVVYSTIPLDYYLSGSGPAAVNANMTIYTENLIAWAVEQHPVN